MGKAHTCMAYSNMILDYAYDKQSSMCALKVPLNCTYMGCLSDCHCFSFQIVCFELTV